MNESDLHKLFTRCGTVIRIQIRCSRGGAVTIGQPMTRCTDRDLQYATIEFSEEEAVRKALRFHGMALHGTQLVVCDNIVLAPRLN